MEGGGWHGPGSGESAAVHVVSGSARLGVSGCRFPSWTGKCTLGCLGAMHDIRRIGRK